MNSFRLLLSSSLGRKYLMAVTGLGLVAFVLVHMLGNLQIFLGRDALNNYAALLKSNGGVLWTARLGLLALAVVHVGTAVQLSIGNWAARPAHYERQRWFRATLASRTMIVSGLVLLAFIVFHLAHFTVGWVDPSYLEMHDDQGRHDVYGMVIAGFSKVWVSIFYVIAMGLLCLHLSHGVSSMFQSLGLRSGRNTIWFDRVAIAYGWLIFLGNSSIPIAILLGYGRV